MNFNQLLDAVRANPQAVSIPPAGPRAALPLAG